MGLRVGRGDARLGRFATAADADAARRPPRRRRRCRPGGTPIRPAASSCATGTARRGPSTCLAAVSSPPTRRSPDRPSAPRLLTTAPGRCASRRSARPACSSRPTTAASCAIRGSCRRSSLRGSCSRATTDSTPDCSSASNGPTTCTCRTSTATTSTRCGWPITSPRDIPSSSPATRPASSTSGCAPSASPNLVRTTSGDELDLGGLTVAIHTETSITDGPGGDSALVVSDGAVAPRRPERLPDHRPRGVGGPRSGRPAPAAVQRGDLVPDGVRARRRRRCARSSTPRWRASSAGRCATSSRSAPAPSCRAPGHRASSIRSCSTST